ncbi:MAG: tRNA (adenosine(37)-N6)-threonylcarbamoyltransferase complex transferase subunit TsaD, partial [Spirulinaceae cyanobacterium RM2_2_10]|nr:tRNA (adenosine(37)-N6)-threonylcarbamoyltransferase complex transferase subunit TsaD [Spirulinaceae cyanobacterium RM2_2_10]
LKTAVLRRVQQLTAAAGADLLPIADLAASFQATVARSLVQRTIRCALDQGLTTIVAAGGVAANSELRRQLHAAAATHDLTVQFPPLSLCTDNAAMIGCAAAERLARGDRSSLALNARSRLHLTAANQLYQLA